MKKFLRWTLWGVAGVLGLFVLLIGYAVVDEVRTSREIDRAMAAYAEQRVADAPVRVEDLGPMAGALPETSGIAVSRAHPGVLWTHNDSGDGPIVYQIDTTGALIARYAVSGAEAIDWESMDVGPCPGRPFAEERAWCLYLGDVGDNARERPEVTIYVVREPDPKARGAGAELLGRLRYRYPDEPHDVEGIAVDPDGDVVIVTKGRTPTILLYEVAAATVADALAADTTLTLGPGTVLPIEPDWRVGRGVTGASIDPSGSLLAVRTYSEIFVFAWPVSTPPTLVAPACFLGEIEPQGEAIAFWTGGRFLLTSESGNGRSGRLTAVECTDVAAPPPY